MFSKRLSIDVGNFAFEHASSDSPLLTSRTWETPRTRRFGRLNPQYQPAITARQSSTFVTFWCSTLSARIVVGCTLQASMMDNESGDDSPVGGSNTGRVSVAVGPTRSYR